MPNDADSLTGPRAQEGPGSVSTSSEPDDEGLVDLYDAEADLGAFDNEYDEPEGGRDDFTDAPFLFGDGLDPYDDEELVVVPPGAPAMYRLDQTPVQERPLPRMSHAERRRRVRLQARRVRRIVRHVEPWSVLKISLMFYACLWVIFLVAGFMMWGVAESSGTVGKVESLIRELFALDTFTFDAAQIFRGYALGGLALAIAGTTFNVLMCLLFNLISDLTGGLRITMIEEETARPTPPRRRRRRPPPRRRL